MIVCEFIVHSLHLLVSGGVQHLDYGDIVYMHAAPSVLKPLVTVYPSAIRFITGDPFKTHHCALYKNAGWPSLSVRRDRRCRALQSPTWEAAFVP